MVARGLPGGCYGIPGGFKKMVEGVARSVLLNDCKDDFWGTPSECQGQKGVSVPL